LLRLNLCAEVIKSFLNIEDYDVVFATPRLPILLVKTLSHQIGVVVLRLWSIRAAKLKDNLRFGAYEDAFLFIPSLIANLYYILSSTYAIAVDHATYAFAKKAYSIVANRVLKVYPPYGFIQEKGEVEEAIPEIVDKGGYVLGLTVLGKKGAYLKFEAKPHAAVLYLLAKKTRHDVVLVGSSYDEWKRVFPGIEPPRNLHIIGKGFSDNTLAKIYRNARLVITPITNRNISNRLLEALFYGKPTITTEVVKHIHPELKHKKHVFVSNWDAIIGDSIRLLEGDDLLENLEQGAREAYNRFFSTRLNTEVVRRLVLE